MSIEVDHVVVYARRSGVGHAGSELCVARTLRFDETQSAARQRYDDVIEGMNVLARLCTRCEGPLGDDDAVIFDLYGWDGFHVCDALFDQVFSESSGIDRQVAAKTSPSGLGSSLL